MLLEVDDYVFFIYRNLIESVSNYAHALIIIVGCPGGVYLFFCRFVRAAEIANLIRELVRLFQFKLTVLCLPTHFHHWLHR